MATPEQETLLDALIENTLVKAALVITESGQVKSKRGTAHVLKSTTAQFDLTQKVKDASMKEPLESVYLVHMSQDFLAVVFEDDTEFDKLRHAVDTLVTHVGLEKAKKS